MSWDDSGRNRDAEGFCSSLYILSQSARVVLQEDDEQESLLRESKDNELVRHWPCAAPIPSLNGACGPPSRSGVMPTLM